MTGGSHPIPLRVCGPDTANATFPLVVFMHAIGLTAADYPEMCERGGLAGRGFVVALVDMYNNFSHYLDDLASVGADLHLSSQCMLDQAANNEPSPLHGLLTGDV